MIQLGIVLAVAGANLDRCQRIQHIELGNHDRVDAVQPGGVACQHRIEPADSPQPPGGGADLSPGLPQLPQRIGSLAADLGWKRAFANAGGVGFEDPNHRVDASRADSGALACPGGARRR